MNCDALSRKAVTLTASISVYMSAALCIVMQCSSNYFHLNSNRETEVNDLNLIIQKIPTLKLGWMSGLGKQFKGTIQQIFGFKCL